MVFKSLAGRKINIFLNEFSIEWDKPSASKFQFAVKQFFKEHFSHLEWFEEVALCGELSALRVDFLCRFKDKKERTKLVFIEADHAATHLVQNSFFFPTEDSFTEQLERDSCKSRFCQVNNARLIRIYDDDQPLKLTWFNETFDFPFGDNNA